VADAGHGAWRLLLLSHFPLDLVSYCRYKTSSSLTVVSLTGDVMEPRPESANTGWPFPFTPQDWEQTPPAVQAYLRTMREELGQLHERVETLETRLKQNSRTSSQPPSTDSPYKKPRRCTTSTTPRKAGGKPGHPGHRQELLVPTRVVEVRPEPCVCGHTAFAQTSPY